MEIAEFLLARIAEDEAVVAKLDREWGHSKPTLPGPGGYVADDEYDGIWVAPPRVLADCEARRQLVWLHRLGGSYTPGATDAEGFDYCATCGSAEPYEYPTNWPCESLRLLALPYVDHPDYDEKWEV